MSWKVITTKECMTCGGPVPKGFRSYCSTKCRDKRNNEKFKASRDVWQRERNRERASVPSAKKVQCLICGGWYVQVGTHIVQVHEMTARQYRKEFGFDLKRGQLPEWYREIKSEQNCDKAKNNLKAGKEFWFKPGDHKAGVYERSEQTKSRLTQLGKTYGGEPTRVRRMCETIQKRQVPMHG